MIGEILGSRYELIEKIGEGGMAVVYKARDNKLRRLVAVKILKKEFADNKEIADKFKKEAMSIANFSDANIVNVLDVGHEEEGNIDYFVMEYVDGKTLKELIVYNGKLSYETSITIAIQIAKALECAHKNNIIHRDVKPQNILVTESGLVKVTDFGIAKSTTSATITNTTTIMGSAHYLSPEQAKGTFVDSRSDIYSLGIVLYEMVTGTLPFNGESPVTIALKHIQTEATEPKVLNEAIPESLNKLIMKCMSKESINRYQSCRELINDLEKIKDNPDTLIAAKNTYDDEKTIIMEPIKAENIQKADRTGEIYTKADFHNEFDEEVEDEFEEEASNVRKNKRKNKKKTTLIVISTIVIAALIIGGIVTLSLSNSSVKEVTVPNIIDMGLDEATAKLTQSKLKIKVVGSKKSDKDENTILEMTPNADKKVAEGTVIEVIVSKGVEKVVIPDLRDYDINYVKDFLSQKGLKCRIVSQEFNSNVKQNYVISQYPEKDVEVEAGSTVELVVSKGPEIKLVMVENYVGKNVDEAKDQLEALNLQVSLVERATETESEDGVVLEQSIQGTRVEEGTTVKLYYGKYKEVVIDVNKYISVGMPLVDAVNALNISGISYTISGGAPSESEMSSYIVKGYSNTIKKGESVKLQVEKVKEPETDEATDTPIENSIPEENKPDMP